MRFEELLEKLDEFGLLMLSDPALPSVVGYIGGLREKGSWWGHSQGHTIFRSLRRLESNPDALTTRLVSGKVTFLHRRLWPDFLTVATAREDWQLQGLRPKATRLLAEVEKKHVVRLDETESQEGYKEAAKAIEGRLLVYTEEFHTDKGFHSKMLMTWPMCPKLKGRHLTGKDPAVSREALRRLIDGLNGRFKGRGRLPWRQ